MRWPVILCVLACSCTPPEDGFALDHVDPASGTSELVVPIQIVGTAMRRPVHSNVDNGTTGVADIAVFVGDVPLAAPQLRSSELIEADVPAGMPSGTYPVSVELGGVRRTLEQAYTVIGSVGSFALPLVPADLVAPPGSMLVLGEGATIDTTTLTIFNNPTPGSTYDTRIDDAGSCGIALLIAERIEVTGAVKVFGTRSLALVSTTQLTVTGSGRLEASGALLLGGPGGYSAGVGSTNGAGPAGGGLGTYYSTCCDSGAGGGGYSGIGGSGGTSGAALGGAGGGIVLGGLDRLCGGSAGGSTSGPTFSGCLDRGGDGGGGGGAVLLGSYGSVVIDGIVSAAGAGGQGSPGCGAGGGGGAGGTVVLAAPAVTVSGTVAANGGGGGAGGDPTPGQAGANGCACSTPAPGGMAYTNASGGGTGGAGATLDGVSAAANANNGGGGGGAAGHIWIATAPGQPPMLAGEVSPATTTSGVTLLDLQPMP